MDHESDTTAGTTGNHRLRVVELWVAIAGIAVTAALTLGFGFFSQKYQKAVTAIDEQRHETEVTRGRATDFVMRYFAATCPERAELMDFPLDQWMNWRRSDVLRTYSKPDAPNIYIPVSDADPFTAVMGSVQYPPDVEAYDGRRSSIILEAIEGEYRYADVGPVAATEQEPVIANCLNGRSEARNLIEPEIPVTVHDVTPLGSDRGLRIVVDAIADRHDQDHVVDESATYSMRVVETPGGLKLKSIEGLKTTDRGDTLLRELCALIRAQVELDPNYPGYPPDGKKGVDEKCR